MLVTPKYQGIELPVYGSEISVPNWFDFPNAIRNSSESRFLRAIGIEAPPELEEEGLEAVLGKTDKELSVLAELCGATVVDYAWGFYKIPEDRSRASYAYRSREYPLVPDQHILVADVAIVQGTGRLSFEETECIGIGIDQYQSRQEDFQLGDLKPKQFMSTISDEHIDRDDGVSLCLVDIEPRYEN